MSLQSANTISQPTTTTADDLDKNTIYTFTDGNTNYYKYVDI